MKIAETVTFGGGGLERAAHLRGDAKGIAQLSADPAATILTVWRGKLLFAGSDEIRLVRLPVDSETVGREIFAHDDDPAIFMGQANGAPVFARDISGWQPQDNPQPAAGLFDPSEVRYPGLPADHRFADLREMMARLSPLDAELAVSAKALFGWHDTHGFCAKCGARTDMSMAGWQRHCPVCDRHHFPRTDPVVIMLITHGNDVLLGRSPGWPPKMYSLLAGFVEPGETLENAVRREVLEEVGVLVGRVDYLASQPWPFPASLMVGCKGEAESRELAVDPVEIEDALWLSREQLMAVFAGQNQDIEPARKGSVAHFLLQNWLADRLD